MDLVQQKIFIRQIIKKALNSLNRHEKDKLDQSIFHKLLELDIWKNARVVLIYLSTRLEINTESIIDQAFKEEKKVAVPVLIKRNMEFRYITPQSSFKEKGPFKIREPEFSNHNFEISRNLSGPLLVIVPGLAFDLKMQRLGRGKGYYDRLLKKLSSFDRPGIFTLALTYNRQIIDSVPVGPHDQKLDALLSESRFYT